MRKTLFISGATILVLLLIAGGVIFTRNPIVFADICPQCFGFHSIGSNIDIQGDSGAENVRVTEVVRQARHQVEDSFRSPLPPVRVLICSTEVCYRSAEGKDGISKSISWVDRAILLSPRGQNITIIAHELTHIELHHLLGPTGSSKVPSWFDEGLAVYVSDDRRYLAPAGSKTRCLISSLDALPTSNTDWWNVMNHNPARAYALAACRVSIWMGQNGGRNGLLELISKLRNGSEFGSAL